MLLNNGKCYSNSESTNATEIQTKWGNSKGNWTQGQLQSIESANGISKWSPNGEITK